MPSQYEHGPDFQTWNEAEIARLRGALSEIKGLLFECAAREGADIRTAYQIAHAALQPK